MLTNGDLQSGIKGNSVFTRQMELKYQHTNEPELIKAYNKSMSAVCARMYSVV